MLSEIPGLKPIMPQGAMYMMIGIEITKFPNIVDDVDFIKKLLDEECIMCLPGTCFDFPNYFRIVVTVPEEKIREACMRIQNFCRKYHSEANQKIVD